MPIRRDKRGCWRYRKVIYLPDGTKHRIFGTPAINQTAKHSYLPDPR